VNLSNAAHDHKAACTRAGDVCSTSLYLLRMTGERLLPHVDRDEYEHARALLQTWAC
jgi:hypothetical protein